MNGLWEDINGSTQSATHVQQLIFALFSSLPKTKLVNFGNKGTMKCRTTLVRKFSRFLSVLSGQGRTAKWRSTQTKIGLALQKICIAIIRLSTHQV
jgi:hypothetical protein